MGVGQRCGSAKNTIELRMNGAVAPKGNLVMLAKAGCREAWRAPKLWATSSAPHNEEFRRFLANCLKKLPPVHVSPSEAQQVLLNLINNSMDAMDLKGGKIAIKSMLDGDHIVVEVSDTGPGIPEANLERIFEPFFTTKPVGKGTGLGLSICYGIMKKMGGQITITSELGQGTTFHIHFPVQQEPSAQV